MRLGAIDIGTNTVRLLVADVEGEAWDDVERDQAITRLGQGVDAERRLDPQAIDRTVDTVERFVRRAQEHGAERMRIAGTSALRDAADRGAFVDLVRDRTAQRVEVLSGFEEGRLSLLGATIGLSERKTYVVCDIGGGSTELATPSAWVSLDIGSVRLKERYLHGDPPTTQEVAKAREAVDVSLDETGRLMIGGYETLVGVAGTITTLSALVQELPSYDREAVHGSVLSRRAVKEWARRLLSMTATEIAALGPVAPGRADVLGAGVLILDRVMHRFLFEKALVSERDILDGLVLDLAAGRHADPVA